MDSSNCNEKFLDGCAKKYLDSFQTGEIGDFSTPYVFPAYIFSKVLVNAYTRLLAMRVAPRPEGKKIYVNCIHPGFVETDMAREVVDDATKAFFTSQGLSSVTTEEAADTPVWLALMPAGGPSGLFWYNRKELSYEG